MALLRFPASVVQSSRFLPLNTITSMLAKRFIFHLVALSFCIAGQQASAAASPQCQATPVLKSTESLVSLSTAYFGELRYQWSILLATNAHSGDPGFRFISDPYHLPAGSHACIPALQDAERLRNLYDRYLNALDQARLATPNDISSSLLTIDPSKPVKVVTWIREAQAAKFQKDQDTAPYDIWVTVVPFVKRFCRDYMARHSVSEEQLTERVEQRLGLPPGAGKGEFVEITIRNPSSPKHFFRPCSVPATNSNTCSPGPPPADAGDPYRLWFYSQYYSSYGTAIPYSYPWTALGYTFDWGFDDQGQLVKFGESEFVIPEGAPIRVDSISSTQEYCGLR